MKKRLLIIVGLSLLLLGGSISADSTAVGASEPGSVKTATLQIEGMT